MLWYSWYKVFMMFVPVKLYLIILAFHISVKCEEKEFGSSKEEFNYWMDIGHEDLKEALAQIKNENTAKNVLLFVGDGLGPETLTAARIYGKSESGFLSFEKFPNIGTLKTYSANKLVPDSCSTATALFCGVKANHKTAGVDSSVNVDDCNASLNKNAQLDSIFKWAQDARKSTGFVTTTRVTHATPAPLYAHIANRNWECEAKIPNNYRHCKDIARQLIEDAPGRNIKVIMGGGRQCLQSNVTGSDADPLDTWSCYSSDGRDLIKDWQMDKRQRNVKYAVVNNNQELKQLDVNSEYILGIFSNGHLRYDYIRDRGPQGMPSLAEMTEKAIQVLRKDKNGFILMVEGGLIDFAHHRGFARIALDEAVAFSDAIDKATKMMDNVADETLILVTSDHAHSMVMTGYPNRNTSILGIAQKSPMDGNSYTTLLYGTGGPNNFQFYVHNNSILRQDPAQNDTESYSYSQQAVVLADEVYHSGTDVNIYAKGPMAHLVHSTHEQTYVAYLVAYASKIGPFKTSGSETFCFVKSIYIIIFYMIHVI